MKSIFTLLLLLKKTNDYIAELNLLKEGYGSIILPDTLLRDQKSQALSVAGVFPAIK
jgi:hypothetical protein